jgi:hypothetical protein
MFIKEKETKPITYGEKQIYENLAVERRATNIPVFLGNLITLFQLHQSYSVGSKGKMTMKNVQIRMWYKTAIIYI